MDHSNIASKIFLLESSSNETRRIILSSSKYLENSSHQQNKKISGLKRCLFGKVNPEDTKRMLEEQFLIDQQRFLCKFGFNIETLESLDIEPNDLKENHDENLIKNSNFSRLWSASSSSSSLEGNQNNNNGKRKILKARRKVCFNKTQTNHSQQFITDFYQARKSNNCLQLNDQNIMKTNKSASCSINNNQLIKKN